MRLQLLKQLDLVLPIATRPLVMQDKEAGAMMNKLKLLLSQWLQINLKIIWLQSVEPY